MSAAHMPRILSTHTESARKRVLPLFIMIDAAGWEILRDRPFLGTLAPNRRRLETVFGYSSACVPSIVSGRWPDEHRHWCYFIDSEQTSPFRGLSWLRWLPKALTSRRIVRRLLTKFVKRSLGFQGYFDLYNIPFQHIHRFDFTEKKSPLAVGGMNDGENIFDQLAKLNIPYFVNDPTRPETESRDALLARIREANIDFAFVYWAGLDGLLHAVGNDSPRIGEQLAVYEKWIAEVVGKARESYEEVQLFVFSDHGMANCDEVLDLQSVLAKLPLKFGRDYTAVFDSTMARFWFKTPAARPTIEAALATVKQGRIVSEEELKQLRTPADGTWGELMFLVREGVLICPSHMGERPIRAMHGYHPDEPQSAATLLTNTAIPGDITAIPHIHRLMHRHALGAHFQNNTKSQAA
jgi:hypothetical protein